MTQEYLSTQTVYNDPAWYYDEQYILHSMYFWSTKLHLASAKFVARACPGWQRLSYQRLSYFSSQHVTMTAERRSFCWVAHLNHRCWHRPRRLYIEQAACIR